MTDANLMEADCIHGIVWYECKECMSMVQTRSEKNGLNEFPTVWEAFKHANEDKSVWKISWTEGENRIRFVRFRDSWKFTTIVDELSND